MQLESYSRIVARIKEAFKQDQRRYLPLLNALVDKSVYSAKDQYNRKEKQPEALVFIIQDYAETNLEGEEKNAILEIILPIADQIPKSPLDIAMERIDALEARLAKLESTPAPAPKKRGRPKAVKEAVKENE